MCPLTTAAHTAVEGSGVRCTVPHRHPLHRQRGSQSKTARPGEGLGCQPCHTRPKQGDSGAATCWRRKQQWRAAAAAPDRQHWEPTSLRTLHMSSTGTGERGAEGTQAEPAGTPSKGASNPLPPTVWRGGRWAAACRPLASGPLPLVGVSEPAACLGTLPLLKPSACRGPCSGLDPARCAEGSSVTEPRLPGHRSVGDGWTRRHGFRKKCGLRHRLRRGGGGRGIPARRRWRSLRFFQKPGHRGQPPSPFWRAGNSFRRSMQGEGWLGANYDGSQSETQGPCMHSAERYVPLLSTTPLGLGGRQSGAGLQGRCMRGCHARATQSPPLRHAPRNERLCGLGWPQPARQAQVPRQRIARCDASRSGGIGDGRPFQACTAAAQGRAAAPPPLAASAAVPPAGCRPPAKACVRLNEVPHSGAH